MSSLPTPTIPRRRLRNLTEVQDIISAWRASGQDHATWCQAQGIQPATLHWYLKRVSQAAPSGFIAVRPRATPRDTITPSASNLTLELGLGLRVTGFGVTEVMALIRSLSEASP